MEIVSGLQGWAKVIRKSTNAVHKTFRNTLVPSTEIGAVEMVDPVTGKLRWYHFMGDDGVVDEFNSYVIPDGGELHINLNNKAEAYNFIIFRMMQAQGKLKHEYEVLVESEVFNDQTKRREARRKAEDDLDQLTEKAKGEGDEASSANQELVTIAIQLGFNLDDPDLPKGQISQESLLIFLQDQALNNPDAFNKAYGNTDKGLFFLVFRGKSEGVIVTDTDGSLRFKTNGLGFSDVAAVDTLKNSPELRVSLQNALDRTVIPTRVAPVAPTAEELLAEEHQLSQKRKEDMAGRSADKPVLLSPREAFDYAFENGLIEVEKGAKNKITGYIWNGQNLGKKDEEVINFLMDNPSTVQLISDHRNNSLK